MKISKEQFTEVYEEYMKTLMTKQAELIIEQSNLEEALVQHYNDSCLYHLIYDVDEESGIYSYTKGKARKIGF